jgi:hypothetical protein
MLCQKNVLECHEASKREGKASYLAWPWTLFLHRVFVDFDEM